MIYIFDRLEEFTEEDMKRALFLLPEERRIKTERIRQFKDRKLSVLSCLLLFYGLKRECGLNYIPEFSFKSHGKPYFKDYPHIHFNMSHCRMGAACIISDRECGIDMQDIRPYKKLTAERVCSEKELEKLAVSCNPQEEFAKIWSVKECMGKLIGTGIGTDLKAYELERCKKQTDMEVLLKPGRYALAAAVGR